MGEDKVKKNPDMMPSTHAMASGLVFVVYGCE
jgi:hypothetical protein